MVRAMEKEGFKAWRAWCRWSQSQAAELLGVSKRTVQFYEKGQQPIPRAIALACYALSVGVRTYSGPQSDERSSVEG